MTPKETISIIIGICFAFVSVFHRILDVDPFFAIFFGFIGFSLIILGLFSDDIKNIK